MTDRLSEAMRYKAQGFRLIPTRAGTKNPPDTWKPYQQRPLTSQEMYAAWPPKGDANVALICGPACHVLVLNVNVKHAVDGRMTLQRRKLAIPRTPEVCTPNGGRAYCFRVPEVPSRFGTYVYPDGWAGIEFRGAGGIQVMPPSRLKSGVYCFAEPWTLERLMADLAPIPPGYCRHGWRSISEPEIATTPLNPAGSKHRHDQPTSVLHNSPNAGQRNRPEQPHHSPFSYYSNYYPII
jgi:hypothetical protein